MAGRAWAPFGRRRVGGVWRRPPAALLIGAAVAGCGGTGAAPPAPKSAAIAAAPAPGAANPAPFAWLRPGAAPVGWHLATVSSGTATLAYPPGWERTSADPGTVSAASVDRTGFFHGYLNLTPQQGAETLGGWVAFRLARNREEGSAGVRRVAGAENLRFRGATGSCLVDDYTSRVAGHRYRELACIVSGRTATTVLIGAAPPREWARLGPLIERSASALLVR